MYRSESNVFNLLVPRFGDLSRRQNREKLMDVWLRSKLFRVSGLDAAQIKEKIIQDCRSGGDFLRIVMDAVAERESAQRWADCTPDHLLFIREIKHSLPNALIVHIIRDGRDVALSYVKQGWSHPLPWDKRDRFSVAGLYWEWIVRRGRKAGKTLGADYYELRFEDLVRDPKETLLRLGEFIGQPLDYARIRQVGIGSVSRPNSSFAEEEQFAPLDRWKRSFPADQLDKLESLVGPYLSELAYDLSQQQRRRNSLWVRRMRTTYFALFSGKLWLKRHTPFARPFVNLAPLDIQ